MGKALAYDLFRNPLDQFDFLDHFAALDTTSTWTDTSADAGSAPALLTTGVSGVALTTGTTDNFDCVLSSKQVFDVTANRPLRFTALAQYTEANTNTANVAIGLSSSVAADTLGDNAAGPPSSYSGALFFKTDGSTTWQVESSVGSTQTTTATSLTAGGSSYQTFAIEINPISATVAEVTFFHDPNGGSDLRQVKDTSGNVVKHTITYTSFAPAAILLTNKTGAGTFSEVLNVDMVSLSQLV